MNECNFCCYDIVDDYGDVMEHECNKDRHMEFELQYNDNTLNVVATVAVYRDEGTYDTPPYTEHEVEDLEVSMYDHEGNLVYLPTELLSKELRDSIDKIINDRVK